MKNSIISEGKTTKEAIENGLKELNVSKNMVDIKILENEEKRSFFSILAPRVVKVEISLKEDMSNKKEIKETKKTLEISQEDEGKVKNNLEKFIKEFFEKLKIDAEYKIEVANDKFLVSINNSNLGFLIGYRGETLYAFQNILNNIANKETNSRVKVILDIENYKEKRQKTLEELAEKLAKTVIKTKKNITLEPMQAYERKIIHTKLQNSELVETRSIGEEPKRKIVISLKRKS